MAETLCRVPSCPAFAAPGCPVCPVHLKALPAGFPSVCPRCHRKIAEGDWITFISIAHGGSAQAHAICPVQQRHIDKKAPKELIALIDSILPGQEP